MATPQGRFVWNELATTDVEGATRFYTRLAPWRTHPWDDDGGYTLIENNGVDVGGIAAIGPETQNGRSPAWTPSVYVYDLDACTRQVPRIGGTVLRPPEEIPNMGCWSLIAGPDGAPLAIYEPADPPKEPRSGIGEFSWHELLSTDWKASWEFYRQLFHWERIEEHDMDRNLGTYFVFGVRGKPLGGMFTRSQEMPAPNWTSYIECDSVAKAAGEVERTGGKVMRPPSEVPGGSWITICLDPQGAMFALTSRDK